MIDEKKLIIWIKCHCNPYGKPDFDYDTSIKIIDFIENQMTKVGEWIPCSERLPGDSEELVLVQVSGKPCSNITFEDALWFGNYSEDEGWILELYPEWKEPDVIAWMPLPEPYRS